MTSLRAWFERLVENIENNKQNTGDQIGVMVNQALNLGEQIWVWWTFGNMLENMLDRVKSIKLCFDVYVTMYQWAYEGRHKHDAKGGKMIQIAFTSH
jgi:hypothetical protein